MAPRNTPQKSQGLKKKNPTRTLQSWTKGINENITKIFRLKLLKLLPNSNERYIFLLFQLLFTLSWSWNFHFSSQSNPGYVGKLVRFYPPFVSPFLFWMIGHSRHFFKKWLSTCNCLQRSRGTNGLSVWRLWKNWPH